MARFSIPVIASAISNRHGLSKNDAEKFVTTLFELINEGLHKERIVKIKGLGTFKIIDVRERESVNVNTGERVTIGGHGKLTFTPDPVMRDLVNKPFAQFETVILNEGVELEELNSVQEQNDASNEEPSAYEESDIDDGNVENEEINGGNINYDVDTTYDLSEEETDTQDSSIIEEAKTIQIQDEETEENNINEDIEEYIIQEEMPENDIEKPNVNDAREERRDDDSEYLQQEKDNEINACEETNFVSRNKWLCLTIFTLFIAGASFFAGYYYNRLTSKPIIKYVKVYSPEKHNTPSNHTDTLIKPDTIVPDKKQDVADEEIVVEKTNVEPKNTENPAKDNNLPVETELAMKNARMAVNTGAYRIVGTDAVITVKKGENIRQISKFYFGDGMECYIQVHNGILEVKDGMRLKIPKLEHKKKKK